MHVLAAGAIVGSVKKRIAQGDCATEKTFDVETLECALMEVHRLFEAEQRQREKLEKLLADAKRMAEFGDINADMEDDGIGWKEWYLEVNALLPAEVTSNDGSGGA